MDVVGDAWEVMDQSADPGVPEFHPVAPAVRSRDDPAAVRAKGDVAHVAVWAEPADAIGILDVENKPPVVVHHGRRDRLTIRGDGEAVLRTRGVEDLRRADRHSAVGRCPDRPP